jgi:hypothetical protein
MYKRAILLDQLIPIYFDSMCVFSSDDDKKWHTACRNIEAITTHPHTTIFLLQRVLVGNAEPFGKN